MTYDVVIIGGGQSGLALGYYLRRTSLSFVLLDGETSPGGSWTKTWQSLRLFSPAQWSSLPGVIMQGGSDYYPTRDEAIAYLTAYERKYDLPVQRPVCVQSVEKKDNLFLVRTSAGLFTAKAVVAATGTFRHPYTPSFNGLDQFEGPILHASQYVNADSFVGQRVAVVGEGNSGAQVLAEVSKVATTLWITKKEPQFLPDHVDGRYLFDAATQMYEAKKMGREYKAPSLGDVVMVSSVKEARDRGVLKSVRPFDHVTRNSLLWSNGNEECVDAIIFCTGFLPSLDYLTPLGVIEPDGKVLVEDTRATNVDGLWLVGFGNWTGFASATLIGVGRSAKATVESIRAYVPQA